MQSSPLRAAVSGRHPFPNWLESARRHLGDFGRSDVSEIQDDALIAAAHDQRGRHSVGAPLRAPGGLGVVDEFKRLRQLAPKGPTLNASGPAPCALSGPHARNAGDCRVKPRDRP